MSNGSQPKKTIERKLGWTCITPRGGGNAPTIVASFYRNPIVLSPSTDFPIPDIPGMHFSSVPSNFL